MVYYALITDQLTCLMELVHLMHDINNMGREWSVRSDMVSFNGGDIILMCRYSGSQNYDAGRTEIDRMLSERWPVVMIDDRTSAAINRLDREGCE